MIFVKIQLYFLFVYFAVLHFCLFESLSVAVTYVLNFYFFSFVGFVYVFCLVHQIVVMFFFMFRCRSAVQFFVIVNFSSVLQGFIMFIILRVYLFVFVRLLFVSAWLLIYIDLCAGLFSQLFILIFQAFG